MHFMKRWNGLDHFLKEMNSAYTSLSRDEQEMLVDQLVNTTLSGMNAEYLLENPRRI